MWKTRFDGLIWPRKVASQPAGKLGASSPGLSKKAIAPRVIVSTPKVLPPYGRDGDSDPGVAHQQEERERQGANGGTKPASLPNPQHQQVGQGEQKAKRPQARVRHPLGEEETPARNGGEKEGLQRRLVALSGNREGARHGGERRSDQGRYLEEHPEQADLAEQCQVRKPDTQEPQRGHHQELRVKEDGTAPGQQGAGPFVGDDGPVRTRALTRFPPCDLTSSRK